MNENTRRRLEGLKDLSKYGGDLQSLWDSIVEKKEAEEAAAQATARAAGDEWGSYDAAAVSYKEYSVMPLRPTEAADLMCRLDKLNYAERSKWIDRALREAKDTLHGVESVDELPNDVYDLHRLHDLLEEALYIAEETEEYAALARLLAVVHLLLPEYEDYAMGRVGITAFCLENYFEDSFDESAVHAAEAVEVAETLRTWAFALLSRIDTVRSHIPVEDYTGLVEYYERLTINLGKQSRHFEQYVRGEEPQGVASPDWAKRILEEVQDTIAFSKEIENGKYDAWELECMANAAAQLFCCRYGQSEKVDAAELLLLTDRPYGHYIRRYAADYDSILQTAGAVDGEGKARGIFIGKLGCRIRNLKNTADKKIEIPRKSYFYRGIIAAIFCLIIAVHVLIADPETTEWIHEGGLIPIGIFLGAALLSGLVAGGFACVISFAKIAVGVFAGSLCMLSLLGFHGGGSWNRWVVLCPILLNGIQSACVAARASAKKISKACAEKEAHEKLLKSEIDQISSCVGLLSQKAQQNLPAGIGFYYLEMSGMLKQMKDRLSDK